MDKDLAKDFPEKKEDDKEDEIGKIWKIIYQFDNNFLNRVGSLQRASKKELFV